MSGAFSISSCDNGQTGNVTVGEAYGLSAVTTYISRPLGSPVFLGGTGPDYPEQTPVLLGADPSFSVDSYTCDDDSDRIELVTLSSKAPAA